MSASVACFGSKEMNLITQYYRSENTQRQAEIDCCLMKNLPWFDSIILLCPDKQPTISCEKIKVVPIAHRATYGDCFAVCTDGINVITNSDISFDGTINAARYLPIDEVWCLTRWEKGRLWEVCYSQDAWVCRNRPSISSDIPLGMLGCDNRIAFEIQQAGYRVKNPSKTIVSSHHHKSNYRTYSKTKKIPPPYLHLSPHHLWEEPKVEVIQGKSISDVTLVCIDCVEPEKAAEALLRSSKELNFHSVKLLSHQKPTNLPSSIEFIKIDRLETTKAYNQFTLLQLAKYISSSHALTIQTDGYVLNPQNWDDGWLQYDYIGAPWITRSWNKANRVGNSGFCLRSKKLLTTTAAWGCQKLKQYEDRLGYWQDDIITCCAAYEDLVKSGFTFAPIEVAADFSFEQPIPEVKTDCSKTFGFHGRLTEETRGMCL